jgi:hypothetical protein
MADNSEWYRITLSRADFEGGEGDVLRRAFQQIYIASNGPPGMAMLGGKRVGGDGYCIYFTPPSLAYARALVKAYSAVQDIPPGRRNLTLMAGDVDAGRLDMRAF